MHFKPNGTAIAFLLFVHACTQALAADSQDIPAAQAAFRQGKKAYEQRNYKDAQKLLTRAANLGSKQAAIQYYLALAAAQNKDFATFKRALARIVVTKNSKEGVGKQAHDMLLQYFRDCEPYGCVSPRGNVTRFLKKDMPIKIHITRGLMMPQSQQGLRPDEIMDVLGRVNDANFYRSLPRDTNFEGSFAQAALAGLYKWTWARNEGLLNFEIANEPARADVVVLWSPTMGGDEGGYCQAMNGGPAGKKVLIQIATHSNPSAERISSVAAHEFGHCWGIDWHSNSNKDIMYSKGGSSVSENDKLTLRALYDIAPDISR